MPVIEELRALALGELGFDLFGVAAAAPLAEEAALAQWCADGCAADLPYVRSTAGVRGDPGRFLPGARSVICVAVSYHEAPDPPPGPDEVRVARFARRRDYHDAIRSRLVRLGRHLGVLVPGARWRPAVDSAPLLERALAVRAGIGFIGKSTCLLHPRFGSELLLGEVVTTVALPADVPLRLGCGSCQACIEACPTGALTAPYRLDARRCIACWTIEMAGTLPPEAQGRPDGSLAGCDLCQTACPWNRRAARACSAILPTRPHLRALVRPQLERLDDDGWRQLVAGTPLRRLGPARLRRNLAALASPQASGLRPQASGKTRPVSPDA